MALWATVAQGRASDSYLTISLSGSNDLTLITDQAVAKELLFSGAQTGNQNVIFPLASVDAGQSWLLANTCSGGFTLTVKAATGTGVILATGKATRVYWDGTNMVASQTDVVAMGAAERGANSSITALTGITSGITAAGGMNLAGALGGNSATPAPLAVGRLSISVAGAANVTLNATQYANPWLEFTGVLTGDISVFVPLTAGALWHVANLTTGAHTLTVIGATGTGIAVTQAKRQLCGSDGTNVVAFAASI